VKNLYPIFPRLPYAPTAALPQLVGMDGVIGSGGRDRTADLGVMNADHPVGPIPPNL
jgi:hypothetical protein